MYLSHMADIDHDRVLSMFNLLVYALVKTLIKVVIPLQLLLLLLLVLALLPLLLQALLHQALPLFLQVPNQLLLLKAMPTRTLARMVLSNLNLRKVLLLVWLLLLLVWYLLPLCLTLLLKCIPYSLYTPPFITPSSFSFIHPLHLVSSFRCSSCCNDCRVISF